MKNYKLILFTILIHLQTSQTLVAQINVPLVDSLMGAAISKLNVVGAAIAIVKDGEVIIQKGYGNLDIESQIKTNEQTNFQIASNSKSFTATALAILVDEGKITWEDKVKDHIPEFKMYNDYVTNNMNIADLLTHRSGLGLGAGDLMLFPDGGNFTVSDVVQVFQHFKPVSAFRTQFDYDNLLYIVAGEVIHRVSGLSFANFIENRILNMIDMKRSSVGRKTLLQDKNVAYPHSITSEKTKKINFFEDELSAPAGGIYSNVTDMTNWMLLLLNRGKYGENLESSLFSVESSKRMWTIHTPIATDESKRYNTNFLGYGLGWFLTDMKGHLVVSHTGFVPGMHSTVILVPDLGLGICILNNTDAGGGALNHSVTSSILDKFFGLNELPWVDMGVKFLSQNASKTDEEAKKVWTLVDSLKQTRFETEKYIGTYSDRWFGDMVVYLKDTDLRIRSVRSPKLDGSMHFYQKDIFAIRWDYRDMNCDALATFSRDEKGNVQSVKMKGISPDIDFSFDFQDLDLRKIF